MLKHIAITLCALLGLLVIPTVVGRAADYKPDDEGFIRNWLMFAPIKLEGSGAEEIDKQQLKDEAKLSPKEGEKAKAGDSELTWKAIKAADSFFDVNEILGSQNENTAGYFVAYINVPAEKAGVTLSMGSNDQGKVYLNGKEVVKFDGTRSFEKDTDKAENV